jgi:hypothetical protein
LFPILAKNPAWADWAWKERRIPADVFAGRCGAASDVAIRDHANVPIVFAGRPATDTFITLTSATPCIGVSHAMQRKRRDRAKARRWMIKPFWINARVVA